MPTGAKSNIRKGMPSSFSRACETMILGDVPTSVIRPPSNAAKDIGISSSEGEVLLRRAILNAIGRNIANVPIFFTNAERSAMQEVKVTIWLRGFERSNVAWLMARSTIPDRDTAALRIRALATMMTMSLEKPEKAFSAGTIPAAYPATSDMTATRS
jgi:hypothetical protein